MPWLILLLSFCIISPTAYGKKSIVPAPTATPEVSKTEVLELTCPKIPEIFVDHSKKSYSAMMDFYLTQEERNKKLKEFFVNVLEFQKDDSEQLEAYNKMREIKSTLSLKSKRAQEIYNNRLRELSPYLSKTRNCWSYFNKEQKKEVENYFNDLQQNKSLASFKSCLDASLTLSKKREEEFNLGEKFFKKEISRFQLLAQGKKIDETITFYLKHQKKVCEPLLKNKLLNEYYNDPKAFERAAENL